MEDATNRDLVLHLIQQEPGIHFQELLRRSQLGVGTLQHHLLQLLKEGRIQQRRLTNRTLYLLPDAPFDLERSYHLDDQDREVLRLLRARIDVRRTSEILGLSNSTVRSIQRRLRAYGLLRSGRV